MWQDKLQELKEILDSFGEKENEGATRKELERLCKALEKALNMELPEAYQKILSVVNGVEFNGFILYGVDENLLEGEPNQKINGLVDSNLVWYDNEWDKRYLFVGDSSSSWYVYDLDEEKCYELDKPSGDEMESFDGMEDMVEHILSSAL